MRFLILLMVGCLAIGCSEQKVRWDWVQEPVLTRDLTDVEMKRRDELLEEATVWIENGRDEHGGSLYSATGQNADDYRELIQLANKKWVTKDKKVTKYEFTVPNQGDERDADGGYLFGIEDGVIIFVYQLDVPCS